MSRQTDFVLIDDDPLVQATWQLEAEDQGLSIVIGDSLEAIDIKKMPLDTPIFVDLRLSGGRSGLEISDRLHFGGYSNLYLTTGLDVPTKPREYLKAVVGKSFPNFRGGYVVLRAPKKNFSPILILALIAPFVSLMALPAKIFGGVKTAKASTQGINQNCKNCGECLKGSGPGA